MSRAYADLVRFTHFFVFRSILLSLSFVVKVLGVLNLSDQMLILRNELEALFIAATQIVKRLRAYGAPIMAAHFTRISVSARKLHDRHDLLLPTYRRYVERLNADFDHCMQQVAEHYPITYKPPAGAQKASADVKPTNKHVRVTITLPADEWAYIDACIKSGLARTRSAYFRRLHFTQRR